jgi:putative spermidine/putrescine transport system ATP-binding protein
VDNQHKSTSSSVLAENGAEPALSITGLNISYGNFPVVNDASMTIGRGEFVTLLGPSGSGKTSILRTVAGYVTPTSGSVSICGRDVTYQPPRLRNCGMVFQSYALFPHMTVSDNIAFGLKARGLPKSEVVARTAEMIEAVRLQEFASRYPSQMSGGQQQRVALARALVIRPDLLLMDEPLAALDLRLREQLQVEIRRIQQKFRISTLFVTHDQGEAFTMSDRILVMNKGNIVAEGAPRDVYLKPPSSFAAEFIGNVSLIDLPQQSIQSGEAKLPGQRRRFRLRNQPSGSTARLLVALRPETINCRGSASDGWSEGTVTARRFSGLSPLVAIAAGDQEILASDQNGSFKVGQKVWFDWSLEDAHVIEETAAGLPCGDPDQALVPADGVA